MAEEWREKLIETLAEVDDAITEGYLEGKEISVEALKAGIRRATLANKINPVLSGSAFKNKGVQPMLDAVVDFLPSPLDVGERGHRDRTAETPAERAGRGGVSRSPAWRSRSRPTRTSASSPSSASTPASSTRAPR